MNLKAAVWFIMYIAILLMVVFLAPNMANKQVIGSWVGVSGLFLFWVPEIIWRRIKR